jgi:hypothetical protein
MAIPFLQPAVNAVKNWADLGGNRTDDPQQNPFRRAKVAFEDKYPRINNPLRFNDQQRADLMPRLGFTSLGTNEVYLAVSRTPADTAFSNVANVVTAIIRHWRDEHPDDSDAAAARKLLEGSSSLAAIDARLSAARLAQDVAEKEGAELDRAYHEYRSIPARYEQLAIKIASLETESNRLTVIDFDAKIKQLLAFEYNPKPGVVIHESIPSLLMLRDTRELRVGVIADLVSQCKEALEKIADDNKRLAEYLDLPEHKL